MFNESSSARQADAMSKGYGVPCHEDLHTLIMKIPVDSKYAGDIHFSATHFTAIVVYLGYNAVPRPRSEWKLGYGGLGSLNEFLIGVDEWVVSCKKILQ
jgi:hypothetical protein